MLKAVQARCQESAESRVRTFRYSNTNGSPSANGAFTTAFDNESGPENNQGTDTYPVTDGGMSSKKARRRKEQAQERSRRTLSPVTIFILGIGLVLVLVVLGTVIFGDREEPPFPGAVWSEQHGHWH